MRRWFAVLFCLLVLSGTQTAAQEWDGVHYRLMLDAPDACWSIAYGVPCVSLAKLVSIPQYCEQGGVCVPFWKFILRSRPVLVTLLAVGAMAIHADMTSAQTGLNVCTLADSSTDEYRANDNRGYLFPAVNLNWLEQLAQYRIGYYNVGTWDANGGYRRNGYSHNVARSGASASYIPEATANLAGLTNELVSIIGNCDVVVYSIGSNDYAPYFASAFYPVYSGSVTPEARASAVILGLDASIKSVLSAKPSIKLVLNYIPDVAQVPLVVAQFPSSAGRMNVSYSISLVNFWLNAQATGTAGQYQIPGLADGQHAVTVSVFNEHGTPQFPPTFDAGYVWNIGGHSIPFWTLSDNPTQGGLLETDAYNPPGGDKGDGHAGSLYSCLGWANVQIRGINAVMGASVPEFSQTECLQHANLLENPTTPTPPPPTSTPVPPTSTAVPTVPTWTPSPSPTDAPTSTPVPTATITNTPPPTLTPVPPTATEPALSGAYIIVHQAGLPDQITFLPVGYTRVQFGWCSGTYYIGIKEPGVSLRKYVCWN